MGQINVASIVPKRYLHLTENNYYHMALAQFIGVDKEYTQFFQSCIRADRFVLMDNGAAEGHQPTIFELIPKAHLLRPTEMVLPDTLLNMTDTLLKGHEALEVVAGSFDSGYKPRLMAVPQGATIKEWVACARVMLNWPISALGISKFLTITQGDTARNEALTRLWYSCNPDEHQRLVTLDIHLLGCHKHPKEVFMTKLNNPQYTFRGTDSAIAFIYTQAKQEIKLFDERPEGEIDFLEGVTELELLKLNIKRWEDYSNGRFSDYEC